MAITKTTRVQSVSVLPATNPSAADTENDAHPYLVIYLEDIVDDADDDDLPIMRSHQKVLHKFDAEGDATVYSSEDQLVQDICGAIWA